MLRQRYTPSRSTTENTHIHTRSESDAERQVTELLEGLRLEAILLKGRLSKRSSIQEESAVIVSSSDTILTKVTEEESMSIDLVDAEVTNSEIINREHTDSSVLSHFESDLKSDQLEESPHSVNDELNFDLSVDESISLDDDLKPTQDQLTLLTRYMELNWERELRVNDAPRWAIFYQGIQGFSEPVQFSKLQGNLETPWRQLNQIDWSELNVDAILPKATNAQSVSLAPASNRPEPVTRRPISLKLRESDKPILSEEQPVVRDLEFIENEELSYGALDQSFSQLEQLLDQENEIESDKSVSQLENTSEVPLEELDIADLVTEPPAGLKEPQFDDDVLLNSEGTPWLGNVLEPYSEDFELANERNHSDTFDRQVPLYQVQREQVPVQRDEDRVEDDPSDAISDSPKVPVYSSPSQVEEASEQENIDDYYGLDKTQLSALEQLERETMNLSWAGEGTPTPLFEDEPTPTPIWSGRRQKDTRETTPPSMSPSPQVEEPDLTEKKDSDAKKSEPFLSRFFRRSK